MTPELKIACEVVFQEHKTPDHSVTWRRDAFRGRVSIGLCEMAKETLVEKKIIYFPNREKKITTVLNPVVAEAGTFEEAVSIIQCKAPSLQSNDVQTTAYAARLSDFINPAVQPAQRIVSISGKPQPVVRSREKWYMKPLFYYILWPVCAAGLGVFITYLLIEYINSQWQ